MESVTFCLWRESDKGNWQKGSVLIPEGESDGEDYLIGYVHPTIDEHIEWVADYYEQDLNQQGKQLVEMIYAQKTLNQRILSEYGFSDESKRILDELKEMGYPVN
ncbi:hypothetical protein ACWOFR_01075 [Carnobacterium gallinarum]|uniref:hypothetical protein n=1 Tax=Carnobacterium gallinarum TaxID=2749 RepID=UPI000691067D|nr:hypothetical protein [Carnobacterium gallinarum]